MEGVPPFSELCVLGIFRSFREPLRKIKMVFRLDSWPWPKFDTFYRPEWYRRGDPMKLNFEIFQKLQWTLQMIRGRKVDEQV